MQHGGLARKYHVFIPAALCAAAPRQTGGACGVHHRRRAAPLIVALHCFGCDVHGSSMPKVVDRLLPAARDPFVVVAPEGVSHSWNAGACCGDAKHRNLDDVGFVDAVVDAVLALLPGAADADADGGADASDARRLPSIAREAIFVTGFSNGGFLASLLALRQRPWIAAVAPQAGYAYDGYERAALTQQSPRRIPILMQHSADDDYVNPGGCCEGGGHCCCGIERGRPFGKIGCVPFWDADNSAFERWRRIYSYGAAGALPEVTERALVAPTLAATCRTFAGLAGAGAGAGPGTSAHRAAVNVTGCLWRLREGARSPRHQTLHHTEWSRPAEPDAVTGVFFAREACEKHGSWIAEDGSCACAQGYGGFHCLTPCGPAAAASTTAEVAADGTVQAAASAETPGAEARAST